jgi:AcrR family transcriptional regulator
MSTEKLNTEIRREQVAQIAFGLVASRGIGKLSIARLARIVGLAPATTYRHFESKEKVVDAVLDIIEDRLLDKVRAACLESPDALERLKYLLRFYLMFMRENQGTLRIVLSEDICGGSPERKNKVFSMSGRYLEKIGDIVRQGQEEGVIRADIDPEAVSILFLGLIQPAFILWRMSDGDSDVTRSAEHSWELLSEARQPKEIFLAAK